MNRRMNRRQRAESGQTLVETALIVPMMLFFILGTIQLGMMHQAKLMSEYAAYRAARAGIVNGGDCKRMKDAAFLALIPTMGQRVDTLTKLVTVRTLLRFDPRANKHGMVLDKVKVEVVNPRKSDLNGLFSTYGSHLGGQEIDWDDVRDAKVIEANLLSVRVRYNYRLWIPFANRMIHSWFMGAEYLKYVRGVQFENPEFGAGPAAVGGMTQLLLEAKGAQRGGDFPTIAALTLADIYVIPLVSTNTMRMQSNLNKGSSSEKHRIETCAVDK